MAAWQNGRAFLDATDGLRGRRPVLIEWRGGQRQPGDEPVPADLRIDHVYLVSCKYLSQIVTNSSPAAVFDRLLAGGHGGRSADWYADVAPDAYDQLYCTVKAGLGECALPVSVLELAPGHRIELQRRLGKGRWSPELRPAAVAFSEAVAQVSAQRWEQAMAGADLERVLWRLLRIGAAPYFVLGASAEGSLRIRIGTAWDWRQHFRLDDFVVTPTTREQPVVDWAVTVTNRRSRQTTTVAGHVEIRWSHGKFAQPPEAKVYLDTPHEQVPGYWPLA
jgi:hypothetical protein